MSPSLCRDDDYSCSLWFLCTHVASLICLLLTIVEPVLSSNPARLPSAAPGNPTLPPRPLGFITESLLCKLNRAPSSHRGRKPPITGRLSTVPVCVYRANGNDQLSSAGLWTRSIFNVYLNGEKFCFSNGTIVSKPPTHVKFIVLAE